MKLQGKSLFSIHTPLDRNLWRKRKKRHDNPDEVTSEDEGQNANISADWLPENVLNEIPRSEDEELVNALSSISEEVVTTLQLPSETACDNDVDLDSQLLQLKEDNMQENEIIQISTKSEHNELDVTKPYHLTVDVVENVAEALKKRRKK